MDSDRDSSDGPAESSDEEPVAKKSKEIIKSYENPKDVEWTKSNSGVSMVILDGLHN